jgi:hypothetical protein
MAGETGPVNPAPNENMNPTAPKTPTTPATNIDKTLISTQPQPAGSPAPTPQPGTAAANSPATQAVAQGTPAPLAQDWQYKRYAYQGF